MSLTAKLDQVVRRHKELTEKLSSAANLSAADIASLSKELSDITPIAEKTQHLRKLQADMAGAEEMMKEADDEMRAMAEDEYHSLKKVVPVVEQELRVLLLPKDKMDDRNAIMEIRSGTGGEEAALFAGDLMRMYQRHAVQAGWRVEIISVTNADMGGIKDVNLSISGPNVFSRLKFESGVHRVQRVPATESQGRVHTSAATVAVLPEVEEVDIQINDNDLRIDVYRSSRPGGQSVNTTDSAVRITHIPSGLVVIQQDEKSQHKNKAKALRVLRARLYEYERHKVESERAAERKEQIGSGDRSERIRTYNFPQGRLTDHRINLTLYKLDRIMEGVGLDEIIDALISEDQAAKLASFDA